MYTQITISNIRINYSQISQIGRNFLFFLLLLLQDRSEYSPLLCEVGLFQIFTGNSPSPFWKLEYIHIYGSTRLYVSKGRYCMDEMRVVKGKGRQRNKVALLLGWNPPSYYTQMPPTLPLTRGVMAFQIYGGKWNNGRKGRFVFIEKRPVSVIFVL